MNLDPATLPKVLILDGQQRSALAAVRSLGRRGIPVVVADERVQTLAGNSRYCRETFVYPPPALQPEAFIETVRQESRRRRIRMLLPMAEVSTQLVLAHRGQFGDLLVPFARLDQFEALTNKWKLFRLAMELGLSIPSTLFIESPADLQEVDSRFSFPVVLKPYRSRILREGKWHATAVTYANSRAELQKLVTNNEIFSGNPFLLQEYIPGVGCGIFALYNQGRPLAFFSHRRLREKPPSGGVSVLSESVAPDPAAVKIATTILEHVRWHGVAMVEFKRTEKGELFLMEVNARFWGSLQLAIYAGVDFPWLLYCLASGAPMKPVTEYQVGVKNRWLLGDLDALYLSLMKEKSSPGEKLKAVCRFLLQKKGTRYEINQWHDPAPFFLEMKQYLQG
jgi:predicted ATP-grasp superfamily ATP-dependent carboligase